MTNAIDMLVQTRSLLVQALGKLSPAQMLQVPDGFDNNIAWNLGHIVVVQQSLHYRLSGLPMAVTGDEVAMYRPGTSPAYWRQPPDTDRDMAGLNGLARQLKQDYLAGRFATYRPDTRSTGAELATIDDAISFNNFHEGLHLGFILALRNLVNPDRSPLRQMSEVE